MRIPQVRKELRHVAKLLRKGGNRWYAARRIALLVDELYRRKGHYRTRKGRAKMTPALRARIKGFANKYPRWDNQRIAEQFNVTNARVSEALHGKRPK